MSKVVISVENVSKQYRLGLVGSGTLREDAIGWWYKVRGKEDPYAKIGETNDRTSHSKSDYVWALKDINFDVKQGEVLGIIGKNGAGKSTLLKLLSRVTAPTTGSIKVKGRIASLLEVGTGFHPELTGRENIYLNGAIMGMNRVEITRKLDEIIDFAGVERYIDTPVKRYSSGMYVRLAFAVAAHLEPEILIIDEVLAVGDAEFQKKALGKMKDVSTGEGRTVLFVSHNMASIRTLCDQAILLQNGQISSSGPAVEIIKQYITINQQSSQLSGYFKRAQEEDKEFEIVEAKLLNENGEIKTLFAFSDPIKVQIKYRLLRNMTGTVVNFMLKQNSEDLFTSFDTDNSSDLFDRRECGLYETEVVIPSERLKPGYYTIEINVGVANIGAIDQIVDKLQFLIIDESKNSMFKSHNEKFRGRVAMNLLWSTTQLD